MNRIHPHFIQSFNLHDVFKVKRIDFLLCLWVSLFGSPSLHLLRFGQLLTYPD